eukprot:6213884-Pleurochrysis_carterae.AAC.4
MCLKWRAPAKLNLAGPNRSDRPGRRKRLNVKRYEYCQSRSGSERGRGGWARLGGGSGSGALRRWQPCARAVIQNPRK